MNDRNLVLALSVGAAAAFLLSRGIPGPVRDLLSRAEDEGFDGFGIGFTPEGQPDSPGGASFPSGVEQWRPDVRKALRGLTGLSLLTEDIVLSIIQQESSGRPDVVGSVGEVGLMQLRDVAARDVGEEAAPTDPARNIDVGTRFLQLQVQRMGNLQDGIRAYNAGAGGARRNPSAGRTYMKQVLDRVPGVSYE